jgi:hypothetical protein
MFFIILGITILILIICSIHHFRHIKESLGFGVGWSFVAVVFTFLLGVCMLSANFINYSSAENKIIVVEQSNAELEAEITESVKSYIAYESKELKELKPDCSSAELIAFAETYPELKSAKLIQEQINTYKENKQEIVELKKEKENDKSIIKFWTFINVK